MCNALKPTGCETARRLAAAEERVKVLEEALIDLMSWFPEKPSRPEWRIPAGEGGADDAVTAARAALQEDPRDAS